MLFVTCSKGEFWDVPCISWHEMLVSHLVVFREEVTYNEVKHLLWRCLLRWTLFLTSFASCHEDVFWSDPCTKCREMLLVMKLSFWDDPFTKCREMLVVMKMCFEMTPVQNVVKCYLSRSCVLKWPLYKISWNATCHEGVFWDDPCTKCREMLLVMKLFWDNPCTKCREMLLVMKVCFEMTPVQNVVKCYLSRSCVLKWPLYKISWNATCHEGVFWDDPCTKCREMLLVMKLFWDNPCTKCREMLLVMKVCFEMTPVQNVEKCYLSWRCVDRFSCCDDLDSNRCRTEPLIWDYKLWIVGKATTAFGIGLINRNCLYQKAKLETN